MSLEWPPRSRFPGLVKSPRVVVVAANARERHKYRGVVLALRLPSGTADRRSRQPSDVELMLLLCCGLRVRLRIQIVPSARGCSAHLPVRHLAVERNGRPVGRDRGRDLLCGPVGDYAAPTGHDDESGHHLERRVDDRAIDTHRGMLLMACGADQEVPGQRHRKFAYGPLPSSSSRSAFAGCCQSSPVRLRGPRHRDHRHCRLSRVSGDHRRPDVPGEMAGGESPTAVGTAASPGGSSGRERSLDRDARHCRMEGRDCLDVALFQCGGLGQPRAVRLLLIRGSSSALTHVPENACPGLDPG